MGVGRNKLATQSILYESHIQVHMGHLILPLVSYNHHLWNVVAIDRMQAPCAGLHILVGCSLHWSDAVAMYRLSHIGRM